MKLKTKSLIIFVIALFAVLICATSVKAAEVTEETFQKMIDAIPKEISVDLPDSEYMKAEEVISQKLQQVWKEKGIDTTGVQSSVFVESNPHKMSIGFNARINGNWKEYTKNNIIQVIYNNSDKYNLADEQVVKNLKIQSPKYYEIDISKVDYSNNSQVTEYAKNYYNSLISDKSITIKAYERAGGYAGFNCWSWEQGTYIEIYKNGVLYEIRTMGQECTIPVITVPSNITENEINSYIVSLLKEKYTGLEEVLNIEKTGKISNFAIEEYYWEKEISGAYSLKSKWNDYNEEDENGSYIIVRREQAKQTPVTTTDTNTNIKLESTTGVVPSDVVLDVKPITTGNAYTSVKKVLTNVSKFVAYDITLKSNGVEIQPNGKLKIKLPIPDGYDTSKLVVYRIDGNNKIKYNVKVETIDGKKYATFETDHFSTYVLAEVSNTNELDQTPKTGTTDIIKYIIPVAIISAVGIVALRRKETK